jgi:uncharacterized membrane protein YgcG
MLDGDGNVIGGTGQNIIDAPIFQTAAVPISATPEFPNTVTLVDPNKPSIIHPDNDGNTYVAWCTVPKIAESPVLGVEFSGVQRTCPCNGRPMAHGLNDRPTIIIANYGPGDYVLPPYNSFCGYFAYYLGGLDACTGFGDAELSGSDGSGMASPETHGGDPDCTVNDKAPFPTSDCSEADQTGGTWGQSTGLYYCWCGQYIIIIQWISEGRFRIFAVSVVNAPFSEEAYSGEDPPYNDWSCSLTMPPSLMFYAEFDWDLTSPITVENQIEAPDCYPSTSMQSEDYPEWLQSWAASNTDENGTWGPPQTSYPILGFSGYAIGLHTPAPTIDAFGGSVTITPFCMNPVPATNDCIPTDESGSGSGGGGGGGGSGSGSGSGSGGSGGGSGGGGGGSGACGHHWLYYWNCNFPPGVGSSVGPFFGGFTCNKPASGWALIQSYEGLCVYECYTQPADGSNCPDCEPGTPPSPPAGHSDCGCGGSGSGSSTPVPCANTSAECADCGTINFSVSGFSNATAYCADLNCSGTISFSFSGGVCSATVNVTSHGSGIVIVATLTCTGTAWKLTVATVPTIHPSVAATASIPTNVNGCPTAGVYVMPGNASGAPNQDCSARTGSLVLS